VTREEAIKELEEDKALYMPEEWIESLDRDTPDGRLITALDMAIHVLKQEPCEDAISRQAVLDATVKRNSIWNKTTNSKDENLEEIISQLPSVNLQEPKTGHWIDDCGGVKCSCCGYCIDDDYYAKTYCPNCGCRMESEVTP
jgi:hypothetical protein